MMFTIEMPTIPSFAKSYGFSRPISTLRFWTSKLRQLKIFQMVPDKIMGVTPTSTSVIPDHRYDTYSPVVKYNTDCV